MNGKKRKGNYRIFWGKSMIFISKDKKEKKGKKKMKRIWFVKKIRIFHCLSNSLMINKLGYRSENSQVTGEENQLVSPKFLKNRCLFPKLYIEPVHLCKSPTCLLHHSRTLVVYFSGHTLRSRGYVGHRDAEDQCF